MSDRAGGIWCDPERESERKMLVAWFCLDCRLIEVVVGDT